MLNYRVHLSSVSCRLQVRLRCRSSCPRADLGTEGRGCCCSPAEGDLHGTVGAAVLHGNMQQILALKSTSTAFHRRKQPQVIWFDSFMACDDLRFCGNQGCLVSCKSIPALHAPNTTANPFQQVKKQFPAGLSHVRL